MEDDVEQWFAREILPLEPMLDRYLRRSWRDQWEVPDLRQDAYVRVYEAAQREKPFNPKHVMMEVFGPTGTVADINYLDVDAATQRVDAAPLPWSYSVTTMAPAVTVNVVAQGDGEVIGCRITVDGDVLDQRTVQGIHAQTFCLVKSA